LNEVLKKVGLPELFLCELSESATDEDVIDNFLTLNFTGVPMSQNHIEYIKSIKMR
jgi:hypothetical protein